MTETDKAFLEVFTKLDIAERIWREEREQEYQEAERLYNDAIAIRDKHFKI